MDFLALEICKDLLRFQVILNEASKLMEEMTHSCVCLPASLRDHWTGEF